MLILPAWTISHTFGELLPLLTCLYLMHRFITGVLLVTSHSSTGI
nr:unnamed protein product [Callosobruchus chinensis]